MTNCIKNPQNGVIKKQNDAIDSNGRSRKWQLKIGKMSVVTCTN